MRKIENDKITETDYGFQVKCKCGKSNNYTTRQAAINCIERKSCKSCRKDYRSLNDHKYEIYQNAEGKWCSRCESCNCEQAYTRKDHAKQSSAAGWKCKKCVSEEKGFSSNMHVGAMARIYNRFKKTAIDRRISWLVSIDEVESIYSGFCALTGWELSTSIKNCTASIDRIDSSKPYMLSNIQWVHTMVNMSKNKYKQSIFIEMCNAVAAMSKKTYK